MRITELRNRIADSFEDPMTFSHDMVLSELGGQTVNQALDLGLEPGDIWKAIKAHYPQVD